MSEAARRVILSPEGAKDLALDPSSSVKGRTPQDDREIGLIAKLLGIFSRLLAAATGLILGAAVSLLIPSVRLGVYHILEPTYLCPVQVHGRVPIRADSMGDGRFGASRSGGRKHRGIDISAPLGAPVLASKSGWAFAASQSRGMGHYVVIQHPDGSKTLYGHLKTVAVRPRQWVWRGRLIGAVGKTGNARSRAILPHLHFELWKDGNPTDPLQEIVPAS